METEPDVLTHTDRTTTTTVDKISHDQSNILEQDPMIEPLIDTDDFLDQPKLIELQEEFSSDIRPTSISSSSNRSCSRLFSRCKGISYAILSSTIFTLSTFIIKQLGVDLYDALLCRFSLQTIILTGFIAYKHYKILYGSTSLIFLQIIRAVVSCAGILLLYASYDYIPLPDVITVRYTQVVWTAIIAMFVFRERISFLTVVAILLTLIGVISVAQPTFLFHQQTNFQNETFYKNQSSVENSSSSRFLGFTLAFACSISFSWSIVLNKRLLIVKIPHSIIIYQFALITLVVLIIHHIYHRFILHSYAERSMLTWQYALGAGASFLQLYSSTIVQKSFKLEHPSIVTIAQSSDILFSVLLQNIFTDEKSNIFVLIGAAFVTTSIFLVAIQKLFNRNKEVK